MCRHEGCSQGLPSLAPTAVAPSRRQRARRAERRRRRAAHGERPGPNARHSLPRISSDTVHGTHHQEARALRSSRGSRRVLPTGCPQTRRAAHRGASDVQVRLPLVQAPPPAPPVLACTAAGVAAVCGTTAAAVRATSAAARLCRSSELSGEAATASAAGLLLLLLSRLLLLLLLRPRRLMGAHGWVCRAMASSLLLSAGCGRWRSWQSSCASPSSRTSS